jgi:hypothetical protein
MKRYILPLFFASVALAGCGSVTSGLDFKEPAGWSSLPSALTFGRAQIWFKASSGKQPQMVFLIRGKNADTMNFKDVPQFGGSSVRNFKKSNITICGNTRAQYVTAVASDAKSGNEAMEMISAPVGDQTYLAMYMRPQAMKPDPAAETAIRSLCAAKTTT